MNALAIHLYLTIRHINLSFNYFGNFYRIIVIRFFRKSGFVRRNTIAQNGFEQTCADYRIAGEKGTASRLNDV